ncbi:MAG: 3-hydroxyacyl-[acyl-carrier-protein] dehydratase FabZ [Cellvibrionales bacterium TMED49]|nr:MAG: 3-hydroxyacyl-[acyl-carrier-protein] dehydratase FabZ [Cellvibrionales bacterium TMED49]|tara:strand:+ start:591 stop:1037 length:447 start_codon:yes stop_codon:yes gene_type:complete
MDINEIMALLPHRYPMLLVDRVLDVVKDERISGYKNVSINENFFNGHFPGKPILPGVIILEAMAQISGILGFFSSGQKVDDGMLYLFAGVDKVRFKRPVVPGDQLLLSSKVISVKRNIWRFSTTARVGDNLASEAILLCAYRYRDKIE